MAHVCIGALHDAEVLLDLELLLVVQPLLEPLARPLPPLALLPQAQKPGAGRPLRGEAPPDPQHGRRREAAGDQGGVLAPAKRVGQALAQVGAGRAAAVRRGRPRLGADGRVIVRARLSISISSMIFYAKETEGRGAVGEGELTAPPRPIAPAARARRLPSDGSGHATKVRVYSCSASLDPTRGSSAYTAPTRQGTKF